MATSLVTTRKIMVLVCTCMSVLLTILASYNMDIQWIMYNEGICSDVHVCGTCCVTVSAFYAECPTKNMYVTASIWTKSKFLGLSLGVHNIGSGTSSLHCLKSSSVHDVC